MINRTFWISGRLGGVMVVTGALVLTACAPREVVDEVDAEPVAVEVERDPEAREVAPADPAEVEALRLREEALARGLDPDDPLDAAILADPDSLLDVRRVHFAFDSSEIRDEDMPILEAHADFLGEHRNRRMLIEGHTDERGSREYNLALGERRAEAVKRLLMAKGVRSQQLEVVSYGEENPLVSSSNEEAWAQNRRAELIYR